MSIRGQYLSDIYLNFDFDNNESVYYRIITTRIILLISNRLLFDLYSRCFCEMMDKLNDDLNNLILDKKSHKRIVTVIEIFFFSNFDDRNVLSYLLF